MTAQGSPRTRFNRAIEGQWVFHAELAAREMGKLSLSEALGLVLLYAEVEPAKFERAAVRWLARYLAEGSPTLLQAQIWARALTQLPTGSEAAREILEELAGPG